MKKNSNKYKLIFTEAKVDTFDLFTNDIREQTIIVLNRTKKVELKTLEQLVDYTIGIEKMHKKIKSFFKK